MTEAEIGRFLSHVHATMESEDTYIVSSFFRLYISREVLEAVSVEVVLELYEQSAKHVIESLRQTMAQGVGH